MLSAQGIRKKYGTLEVLKGVNLEVQRQEIVALVGSSGAGKSTLLHILGTLDKPDQGSLTIEGRSIFHLPETEMAAFRNQKIGFVFQFHNLLPEFSALENVMIPGLIGKRAEKEVKTAAEKLLKRLGLEHRIHHKPAELSGGEQQRAAVARALVNQPLLVLADEPSGNLDSKNAAELHQLFFELRAEMQQTFVIVTHNPQFAAMADRTIEIRDGHVANVN
jgi:lipoprotein-releasing system ATP-binding protein